MVAPRMVSQLTCDVSELLVGAHEDVEAVLQPCPVHELSGGAEIG